MLDCPLGNLDRLFPVDPEADAKDGIERRELGAFQHMDPVLNLNKN